MSPSKSGSLLHIVPRTNRKEKNRTNDISRGLFAGSSGKYKKVSELANQKEIAISESGVKRIIAK